MLQIPASTLIAQTQYKFDKNKSKKIMCLKH